MLFRSNEADAVIRLKRAGLMGIARNNEAIMKNTIESVEGQEDILDIFTDNLAQFEPYFNIIEP